jgi:hypothetical protein
MVAVIVDEEKYADLEDEDYLFLYTFVPPRSTFVTMASTQDRPPGHWQSSLFHHG